MSDDKKLQVYYDGACIICDREISMYKKRNDKKRINFIDISQSGFNATKHDLDPQLVQKVFHVKTKEGKIIQGVDAFVAIWDEIDSLAFLAKLARIKIVRWLMGIGYKGFVIVRPILPRKKCETDQCQI